MTRFSFFKLAALSALSLCTAGCATSSKPAPSTPTAAAEAFYRKRMDLNFTGLPNSGQLAGLAPRLTPELRGLFAAAQKSQKTYLQHHPGEKPPWVEGDLFSSLFEGVSSFRPGAVSVHGEQAQVKMLLVYNDAGKPAHWTDSLVLRHVNGQWLVDDILMQGKWAFKNGASLRKTLTASPD
jgi:hypothetical protein